MSTGVKKNRAGLVEMYQANLFKRIQQGDWNIICRDEELVKEVEGLLSNRAAQDTHSPLGLDPLSVMEYSLRRLPTTSGQTGLERLSKAFEVLELAALNLYLCPWRKEYRVVKTFSGMFTHYVKPALTSQQAKELFGLLGYQSTGPNEEEELRLNSKPVHAECLLQLACAFFTARVECQLLLSEVAPVKNCVEWELQLVQERKRGHTLQIAQESAKRKLESMSQSSDHDVSGDLDLYTDDHTEPGERAENSHMTAPPNSSYTPPAERTAHTNTNQSKEDTVCVTENIYQVPRPIPSNTEETNLCTEHLKNFANERKSTPIACGRLSVSRVTQICSCTKSNDLYPHQCVQCKEVHNLNCPYFKSCREQQHELVKEPPQRTVVQTKAKKDNLKKHSCVNTPTSDIFLVCYNCQNIHDFGCEGVSICKSLQHYLQITGRVQPPRLDLGQTSQPERHKCLTEDNPPYVVCNTCLLSHDCLCEEVQKCEDSNHDVSYRVEMKKAESPSKPMPFHQCCTAKQPTFVCLTCKVFHAQSCEDRQCYGKHDVQELMSVCTRCSHSEPYTICRYCCAQYCKKCWFKNPLQCKCGMPFNNSSV
ncbi:spermatogenesis associated 2-like [Hoplias malabaricus]|uniref:spermatogenesis associated 2-like n=1 Tax=Hoplias malabaricus TaxID=27720 RepID=UPI003462CFAA